MSTSSTPAAAAAPVDAAASAVADPAGTAVQKAGLPAAANAEGLPVAAVRRTRNRASAPKPTEVAATQSAPVGGAGLTEKRSQTKVGVAAKTAGVATMPAVRKPVRKVTASSASTGDAGAKKVAPAKLEAPRKRDKLVRDSFTMPKSEYALLGDLKQRAAGLARPAKKSELLRAGIKALAGMGDTAFLAALYDVPALKTGRPAAQDGPAHKDRAGKAAERRGS